ncbi:MAG: O-antigen ligase family protein [Nitrospirota bacterium]
MWGPLESGNQLAKPKLTVFQEMCLYGILATVPMFKLGTLIMRSETFTPAKFFVLLALMALGANILLKRDVRVLSDLVRDKVNLLILIFLSVSFISLVNARYIRDFTFAEIAVRIKMAILFFTIVAIIRDRRTAKFAVWTFIVGSLLTVGVGLYELAVGKAFLAGGHRAGVAAQTTLQGLMKTAFGKFRVQGLYGDAGFHAHAMVIFSGLALPWLFYSSSKMIRIFVGALLIGYVINLIGTGARVGWVSLGFMLLIFMVLFKHRYKYAIWTVLVTSVVVIFLVLSLIPHVTTFDRLHTQKNISFDWRLATYGIALEMVRDHPLLGVGTGNYLSEYHNYLDLEPGLSRYYFGWLHNSYLQIWAENGTIGLLVFLLLLFFAVYSIFAAYRRAADLEMKALTLSVLIALLGYLVEFSGIPAIGQELGWILLGFSVAVSAVVRKESTERERENLHYEAGFNPPQKR